MFGNHHLYGFSDLIPNEICKFCNAKGEERNLKSSPSLCKSSLRFDSLADMNASLSNNSHNESSQACTLCHPLPLSAVSILSLSLWGDMALIIWIWLLVVGRWSIASSYWHRSQNQRNIETWHATCLCYLMWSPLHIPSNPVLWSIIWLMVVIPNRPNMCGCCVMIAFLISNTTIRKVLW